MQKYCLGFAFNENLTKVALIRKNKPKWQAGKLNGVGGKVENGESNIDAMCREFAEEAGLLTTVSHWHYVLNMGQNGMKHPDKEVWDVAVFTTKLVSRDWLDLYSATDEKLAYIDLNDHAQVYEFIDNIDWLVSMCKNLLRGGLQYSLTR